MILHTHAEAGRQELGIPDFFKKKKQSTGRSNLWPENTKI